MAGASGDIPENGGADAEPVVPVAFRRSRIKPPDRPCADVSPREARYLLTIQELERAGASLTQTAVARAMSVAPPTALEMIRRLRALGLVESDQIALTPEGTSAALLLASRRHAASVLTRDVLGLDDEAAGPEVDRIAPSLSAEVARRLLAGRNDRS